MRFANQCANFPLPQTGDSKGENKHLYFLCTRFYTCKLITCPNKYWTAKQGLSGLLLILGLTNLGRTLLVEKGTKSPVALR
jgi:hypothetical protein